ncbi:hypothetical protein [Sporocytophaga myxococcoides]|nr:hypothetical protein [Sporocytophaga myxococcoides]
MQQPPDSFRSTPGGARSVPGSIRRFLEAPGLSPEQSGLSLEAPG